MKRLKIPRIPTRIPLPDLPRLRRSSQKTKAKSDISVPLPPEAEERPDIKSVDQIQEANKVEHRKVNVPKIPLPSLSKPSMPKLHAPNIPLPSLSKPSMPKLHAPNIPLPSVSIPNISKKSASLKEKGDLIVEKSDASMATAESDSIKSEQPEIKGRAKFSMPKMPSLHKTKDKPITHEPAVSPIFEHEMAAASTPAPVQKEKAKASISKIHMPAIHKAKEIPVASAATEPAPQLEETKNTPKAPVAKAKGKSKMSMPNLKLPKVSMPSLSLGKGGARSTDKRIKGSTKSTGKRILALTIEGTDVRLVSYHNSAIESWKSVSFDARLLKMGQVADPEGLGEVIKTAITGIETNKCYVVCALPGLRSVSRIITIPNVGKKDLDSVVPREVRRTMTVSEEDNYFHWQVLPSETETAQTHVFLLAVPKEPMSLLLRAFSHASLNPSSIDLKPLALMRAVNQKDAIIANCEGNSMELVIVSDDIPVLIRSVFLGEGVANQDYAIGRISDELGRTIVTYNEINKEHPLNPDVPVYLTGAAASGVPFALNVAALTGRTVQPLETPLNCPTDLPIAEYMVNIGLILKVV
jgi:hypothetical protein